MALHVFISYRSDDTGETASRLCRELERVFGQETIFLDQERIGGGTNWPERLRVEVRRASVVLLLIGRRWLTIQDPETGDRRLNVPEDWVRLEVEEAIQSGCQIVPILVEGARPLSHADLRTIESISGLADLHAMALRRREWDSDLSRVVSVLVEHGFTPLQGAPMTSASHEAGDPLTLMGNAKAEGRPPRSRSSRPAVAVGFALLALLGTYGMYRLLPDGDSPSEGRGQEVPGAPSGGRTDPLPDADTPGELETPSAPPADTLLRTVMLDGEVNISRLWMVEYRQHYQDYTIEARASDGTEKLGEAALSEDGRFGLDISVPTTDEVLPVELSWKWTTANRFVLWPVLHPRGGPPFGGYSFKKLDDVFHQEKQSIRADVGDGRFDVADAGLRSLERLLSMFEDPQQVVIPGFRMGELGFKLLQEICTAAHEYRETRGRSQISNEMIEIERQWRKKQFVAARRTAQSDRSLVRALNAWADFSRESYSRGQRGWSDHLVGASADALGQPLYHTWLREDLVSVGNELRWLGEPLRASGLWSELSSTRRTAYEQAVTVDADEISMSRLVDLLTGLTALYR
jgi:hypothetical protein